MLNVPISWESFFIKEMNQPYFKNLMNIIQEQYAISTVYPHPNDVFKALELTPKEKVRVVILGQDPYHGENEANGLAFSVNQDVKTPPSLRNILKELNDDLNINRNNTDLTDWAKQGVLLLNSVLTVKKDNAASHSNQGWELFTDHLMKELNESIQPIIFVFWGNYAKSKKKWITNPIHTCIESAHPSPLSSHRGFFGSKPFSTINTILVNNHETPIKW